MAIQAEIPVLRELRALRARRDQELRALVTEAAHAGVRSQDIAEALGVSRSTLWRHYGPALRLRADRD